LLNLIVLVIDGDSAADFPVLDLTSRRPLQVGDHLTALVRATDGSTVRIPGSVTARSRNTLYGKGLDDLVTDVQMALPAHGFGAPLLDEQERVVGLCLPPPITASPAELAEKEVHALPAMLVRNVQKMIMAFPTFEQPWLGLATQRSGGDGLEVAFVWEGGPAAHVDIQVGDRLREAAGEQLTSTTDLQRLLAKIGEGRDLDLEFERAGQVLRRTIRIERRPPWAAPWIESGDQP
jgi:S1-C subfamily serine protease